MSRCRGCGSAELCRVLDLGAVPAADDFPSASEPVTAAESSHPLAMNLCGGCGLAQLADDDTNTAEPRGIEPQALRDQALDAVARVADSGWLRGTTVREFGSPHGGTWLPLLATRGYTPARKADVVLDSFGIMHEPDQRLAFEQRAAATAGDGVLLLQFHSLLSIVEHRQWSGLRHGHFAYYSLTAIARLLAAAGMSVVTAWQFDLYGGTVLLAAVHGRVAPDAAVEAILRREREVGVTDPAAVGRLQSAASNHAAALRDWLNAQAENGQSIYGYGATSRVAALFSMAGVRTPLIRAIADASPAKQGRRIPGTDVAIIAPEQLVLAEPDAVLLMLPDLYDEVRRTYPGLEGRWRIDAMAGEGYPSVPARPLVPARS
ncbi:MULTISPECIES: class I SAM-dependent methyltransferase [Mycolicibacter]|uniref:Class I SAM-dependent methyltransferase n=1 Tax=[Mycobacterium] vasticus TaxID=2875777 RepID=A0ABU5YRP8_9MYCO|nr:MULTISPECIES: class I SAM-dependent methyltransferase [unclassified Mycolicibacter]MEB3061533.1 class I SAM-dependent methyltransferase [Mycolicibacter sp. MYC101]MEB3067788.1 class I SAM-dependent methyltransferase [Mycolicibacter sp. MYC017]